MMQLAWIVAAILLAGVIGQYVLYNRIKKELRQEKTKVNNLVERLSIAEQELLEVKARRKKLLSASTQALIIVESDFLVTSANKVARRLFGRPRKETTLMGWVRQYQLQELVERTLEGEKMPPLYFSYRERALEAHARSIKERKEIVAVALAIHDITETQQLSRARSDFVANISHELRTPLASIQLLTDTLLEGGLEDHTVARDLVEKMATQVDALHQLAQEVLDLSLIESGKAPLKLTVHPLEPVVRAQTLRFLPQIERKNLSLTIDISPDLQVLCDNTMIGRVISNLLHNAIKFTETGGICVSAQRLVNGDLPKDHEEPDGDWVCISVSDTGVGIAPDELSRIFERFYKVDRARNRQESGTGLGLAISRHIVEAHGGKIWADQRHARGAHFHFTLPTE